MGVVTGLLGMGGGAGGTGTSGPMSAPITSPITQGMANSSWDRTQGSMQAQQQLLAALQAQQGLANQNQVYGQLQGVVNGTGPNPAQAMLNQATGQNVANQAALMAGQRGVSQNPGLVARQAARQGADIQQNAVGQGATLQAQQAMNAMGMAGQLANTQAGNQIAQTNANAAGQLQQQGNVLNAQGNFNNAVSGTQNSINSSNAAMATQQAANQGSFMGGLLNSAGAAMGFAQGGDVPGPKSSIGRHLMACGGGVDMSAGGNVAAGPGQSAVKSGNSYSNDKIPALLSEHEIVLPREVTMSKDPVKESAKFVQAVLAKRKVR